MEFKAYLEKLTALDRAVSLLSFDQSTGAPRGGAASRAKNIGILAGETFKMCVSDQMKGYLDELSQRENELDEMTLAMYKECKKEFEKNLNIPADEFRAYSELTARSQVAWEDAKEKSDFKAFAPYLKEIIEYQKRFISYRGYKEHPYNTLLDDYEPDMTVVQLDKFFAEIKASIVPLLKEIGQSNKKIRSDFLGRTVSKDIQMKVSESLMDLLGYDLNRGMIRESEHPFSSSFGQNDVRITTHYHEKSFASSFYSVIHEVGHALYEQGISPELADTILESGVSMGIHESQSRFYENIIGRSYPFWETIFPEFQKNTENIFSDVSVRELYEAVNIVQPSFIRIEADELTYPLHIMVRYEIEKEIFSSSIDVMDLPELWNDKMREYLGIVPPDDAHGILQDVHWSDGYFGYFPSYALGSAYAAQIFHYIRKDLDFNKLIEQKNIKEITAWLKERIHRYGMLKTPKELIRGICGEELNAAYYTRYLEEKYKGIYMEVF